MNDYLTKPIRVDELVGAIKRTPRREVKKEVFRAVASTGFVHPCS